MIDYNGVRRNDAAIENAPQKREAVPLAMAYVRKQEWETPSSAMESLQNGTAFKSLVKPFWAMEVRR